MNKVIVITGASSGFGALTARALAVAGHRVYAGMRETAGRNSLQVASLTAFANEHGCDLRWVEMDVASQKSIDAAFKQILDENGRLDVLIHNGGHVAFGPAEAFTQEQLAELYDVNVLRTQRVNRAVLPTLRKQGEGLVVWVSSSGTRGGTPPYLAPYFAAKAAMDALAISYAGELARFGIETSIIVAGAFTSGTNHFAHTVSPSDKRVAAAHETDPNATIAKEIMDGFARTVPPDADVSAMAETIVRIVALPFGKRPFRVHIDPADDGAEVVNGVADRVRAELLRKIGLADVLKPAGCGAV